MDFNLEDTNKNLQELTGIVTTLAKRIYEKEDGEGEIDPQPEASEKTSDWEKSRALRSKVTKRKIMRAVEDIMGENGNGNGEEEYMEEEYPDMIDEKARFQQARARYARYNRRMHKDDEMPMDDMPMDDDPNGMMPYDEDNGDMFDDDEMMMARKLLRAVKGYQPKKGYAGAAKVKTDEEDSPFGDKDGSVKGNEASPQGRQGGDREEETFGPGGMAYRAMLVKAGLSEEQGQALLKAHASTEEQGQEIAKALIPDRAEGDARRGEEATSGTLTREMQTEIKSRSFRDINRFRESVGDLPHSLV